MKFFLMLLFIPASMTFAQGPSTHSEALCTYKDQLNEITARFDYEMDSTSSDPAIPQVTSTLTLNGVEIPAQQEHCAHQNIPGRRGYSCSHRAQDGITYTLYPKYDQANGVLEKASLLIWNQQGVVHIDFTSCQ